MILGMKLVAMVCAPARPDEAAKVLSDASGIALAEARMRLAPEPPALLARLAPDKSDALVAVLRKAGLAALAVDLPCPTDRERTLVRSFSVDATGLSFTTRSGSSMFVGGSGVLAVLRGLRASRVAVARAEKSKQLSVGAIVATGGLMMTAPR